MKKSIIILVFLVSILNSSTIYAQDPYIGEIRLVAFNFAPQGWALCNGQILPISQNQALFVLLGTTYGGNGVTTFALPDLRGRAPIHAGQGPGLSNYSLGQIGGTETNIMTVAQMPRHSHAVNAVTTDGNIGVPTGALPANTNVPAELYH